MLVLLVFLNSLQNEFLQGWDDYAYAVNNEAVRGWNLNHVGMAFTKKYVGNIAPFHILSYTLDHFVWGLKAAGFRFSNILIHAVNVLLVFALISRLGGSRIAAVTGSFIFAVHPVQVESVVWISQRKNVLSLFFFLLSFHLYMQYACGGKWNRYAGSLSVFLCALLTKPAAVVFPFVIALYNFSLAPAGRKGRIKEVVPYFFLSLVFSYITLKTQAPSETGGGGGIVEYHGGSPHATFLTMMLYPDGPVPL